MRALTLLLLSALPLQAHPDDPLPMFDLDQAISCLAYAVNDIERDQSGDVAADRAQWLVYFGHLITAKSTESDRVKFDVRFKDSLAYYRDLQAALDDPARRDEADFDLTASGKMCWFQALAAEGGPFHEP